MQHAPPVRHSPPLVLLLAVACARSAAEAEPAGSTDHGRVVFRKSCAICHGERGDGQGRRAFGLSRPPADFTSTTWRARVTEARVIAVIRDGVRDTPMAAWPSLTDNETRDVAAYILSVAERGP
jgi:mono/diheme cytochrome c family protein